MIYIGIDISKYKHDCFICNDTGEVIVENFSFENTKKRISTISRPVETL